jgi:hypothetical protein
MPEAFGLIEITSHRDLLTRQRDVALRMVAQPDLAVMLLRDPLMAFERMGVRMSPAIAGDMLHAIQHPCTAE